MSLPSGKAVPAVSGNRGGSFSVKTSTVKSALGRGGVKAPALRPVCVEDVIESYRRHGSGWKAGKELGINGQQVYVILRRHGIETVNKRLTEDEYEKIRQFYLTTPPEIFDLDRLVAEMGRDKTLICRVARDLGLTDQSRPMSDAARAISKSSQANKWANRPHPRGMTGKKHTQETLRICSEASKRIWATHKAFGIGLMSPENREKRSLRNSIMLAARHASKNYTRTKGGVRADIGDTYFRSSWEANYARYLNKLIQLGVVVSWEYEPETFWFKGIKRGTLSYRPDFRVIYKNDPTPEYVEIKGWIVAKDHTKWRRMKKYHPHIKLTIVAQKEYNNIKKQWASSIPNWEDGRQKKPEAA